MANSPTAAEVAAAKASILSVIALSIRMLVEPGDDRSGAGRRPAFDGSLLYSGSKCGASASIGLQTFR
jgi:hypothetical protein